MASVLIVSTYYTKNLSVGSERVRMIVNHFLESGWDVTLLAPESDEEIEPPPSLHLIKYYDHYRLIRKNKSSIKAHLERKQPTSTISKIKGIIKNYLCVPDPFVWWIIPASFALLKMKWIEHKKFDLILSSSNPKTPHLIGYIARYIWNSPWVMEYRDFWTIDHYYEKYGIIKKIEAVLEREIVSKCTGIITVSPQYAKRISDFFGKRARSIYNAYDKDSINKNTNLINKKFTITYTGNLAKSKRDPSDLFRAIYELIKEGHVNKENIEIIFIGRDSADALRAKYANLISECITCYPYLKRDDALRAQELSHILLMIFWDHPMEEGVVTGKFEYFASLRPIFGINGQKNGVMRELLNDSKSGMYFERGEYGKLKDALIGYYKSYTKNDINAFVNDVNNIEFLSCHSQKYEYMKYINEILNNENNKP